MSSSFTIRYIDDATARWISEEAERRSVSAETLIVELIRKGITVEAQSSELRTFSDLDSLAGTWSEEQAREFLDTVADFEQVDEKLWQ